MCNNSLSIGDLFRQRNQLNYPRLAETTCVRAQRTLPQQHIIWLITAEKKLSYTLLSRLQSAFADNFMVCEKALIYTQIRPNRPVSAALIWGFQPCPTLVRAQHEFLHSVIIISAAQLIMLGFHFSLANFYIFLQILSPVTIGSEHLIHV